MIFDPLPGFSILTESRGLLYTRIAQTLFTKIALWKEYYMAYLEARQEATEGFLQSAINASNTLQHHAH